MQAARSSQARRVAVIGAGAIGGVIAAQLAGRGHLVTLVARGARLATLRAQGGLWLDSAEGSILAPVAVHDDPATLGAVDVLFICVKAQDVADATTRLDPVVLRSALIVPVLNGIPWWYRVAGAAVRCVDPDGVLAARFGASRLVGAVTHLAAEVAAVGRVRQTYGGRTVVGCTTGGRGRGEGDAVVELFEGSGLDVRAVDAIVDEIWLKLAGNAAFNPVAALSGANMAEICADEHLLGVVRAAMGECMAVGTKLGVVFPVTVEQRIDMGRRIGAARPSMLQDLERGRPPEADALIGAVAEIGHCVGVPTPAIDLLYALVLAHARYAWARN